MDDDPNVETATRSLLAEADAVFEEYDQGYLDADAALSRLRGPIEDLQAAVEE